MMKPMFCYCSRLKNLIDYYLNSRQVNRDYEKVVSLLVADRLKSVLPSDVLKHVLSVEQASGSAFFNSR
jgi:hypothetical protein